MNAPEKENTMRHIPLWRRFLYKLTGGCLVQHQWNNSGTTTSGHLIYLCQQCGKKVVHFAKVESRKKLLHTKARLNTRDANEPLHDHEKRTDVRRLMQDWHNEQQER